MSNPTIPVRKGEFCAIRIKHSSTALVPGLAQEYLTFEIVQAAKADRNGKVLKVQTPDGTAISAWDYCYAIPEFQAEAKQLFDSGDDVRYDSLAEIRAAILRTKEDLADQAVHNAERATEKGLGQ